MAQQEIPQIQFPRWFPNHGGGAGYNNGSAAAISQFSDDLASALWGIQAQREKSKRDDLSNAMMNNGQSPGAPAYVRRAEYPDGDQGDDPGATPFASTDTPYTGGQVQAEALAANAAAQQKAQQQSLATSIAANGRPMSEYERYQTNNPSYIPGSGRRQYAPGKGPSGRNSALLPMAPGAPGIDPLPEKGPVDGPAMPPSPMTPSEMGAPTPGPANSVLSSLLRLLPGGTPPAADGPPEASPSATPLIANAPGGVPSPSNREEAMKLPPGTRFRGSDGKIHIR